MPLYEYRCLKCDRHTDKIEKVNGPHLKKCPHCGGKVESVITAPSIQFKGSGWYVNDYGRKTSGGDSAQVGEGREAGKNREVGEIGKVRKVGQGRFQIDILILGKRTEENREQISRTGFSLSGFDILWREEIRSVKKADRLKPVLLKLHARK